MITDIEINRQFKKVVHQMDHFHELDGIVVSRIVWDILNPTNSNDMTWYGLMAIPSNHYDKIVAFDNDPYDTHQDFHKYLHKKGFSALIVSYDNERLIISEPPAFGDTDG